MKNLSCSLPVILLLAAPLLCASALAQTPASASDALAPTLGVKSAAEIDREWQQSVARYDGERNRLLAEEQKQENDGPFRADWATLTKYQQPEWYKDAKFGIFIHWGVYSVPAAENEWYPRNMYRPEEGAYKNFHEHFANGDESRGLQGFDSALSRRTFRCCSVGLALQGIRRALRRSCRRASRRLFNV